MDIREKKTKRSIYIAFLKLRSKKQLKSITVKELAETAKISKATFYLHYKDIYDLSEQLQSEVLQSIICSIPDYDLFLQNPAQAHKILQKAFLSKKAILNILFSGDQESILPASLEKQLKHIFFEIHPELKNNILANTSLSFFIMGGFYSYLCNCKDFPPEEVSVALESLLHQYQSSEILAD